MISEGRHCILKYNQIENSNFSLFYCIFGSNKCSFGEYKKLFSKTLKKKDHSKRLTSYW